MVPSIFPILKFVFTVIWRFLLAWWWLLLPLYAWQYFKYHWLWWRNEVFDTTYDKIMMEIRMPFDTTKPLKAMENVFASLWQIHDPEDKMREKWVEGKYQTTIQFELVSTEGEVHLYVRCPRGNRYLIESAIHAQYPEAELAIVDDYTKLIPRNIPNKDWELWGCDYRLEKPSPYPIRTYKHFFEESPEMKEEKKVDPTALLYEGLSRLGQGEHVWIQFILKPIYAKDMNYLQDAVAAVSKITGRKIEKEPGGVVDSIKDIFKALFGGLGQDVAKVAAMLGTGQEVDFTPVLTKEEEKELFPKEMRLTPGERDILQAIEDKVGQYTFRVVARFIYIARRDRYMGVRKTVPMSFFTQFSTNNLNNFKPYIKTITKSKTWMWFLDKKRTYLKKRQLFRWYTMRTPAYFPWESGMKEGFFIFSPEELASIIHFPSKLTIASSAVPRVANTKGQAPPNLPTE